MGVKAVMSVGVITGVFAAWVAVAEGAADMAVAEEVEAQL